MVSTKWQFSEKKNVRMRKPSRGCFQFEGDDFQRHLAIKKIDRVKNSRSKIEAEN